MPGTQDCSSILRSVELAAHAAKVFPKSCHTKYSDDVGAAFQRFKNCRQSLVASPNAVAAAAELSRPRTLLAFNWRSSLFDGAATPLTHGFVNDDYMPAWDSWLHIVGVQDLDYDQCCLISWVPDWLAAHVNDGIAHDPAESMSWCNVDSAGEIAISGWGEVSGDSG